MRFRLYRVPQRIQNGAFKGFQMVLQGVKGSSLRLMLAMLLSRRPLNPTPQAALCVHSLHVSAGAGDAGCSAQHPIRYPRSRQ